MKKLVLVALMAMVGMGVVVNSCSKSDNVSSDEGNKIVQTPEDIAFQNRLIAFRDKVSTFRDNPTKDGELMDVDIAILNIESLFNSTYGFSDVKYSKTKADITTVLIPLNNGKVLMSDIVATFDDIHAKVLQYYNESDFAKKEFYFLDLKKIEVVDDVVEVSLRSVVGEKDFNWEVFDAEDYWGYGYIMGACDELNPSLADSAADKKIQDAIMANRLMVNPPTGYHYEYEDEQDYPVFGTEFVNANNENLIFCIEKSINTNFTEDEMCINPTEMNFHFNGEMDVIYNLFPASVPGFEANRVFRWCTVDGYHIIDPDDDQVHYIHHQNSLTYALRYLVEDSGGPIKL